MTSTDQTTDTTHAATAPALVVHDVAKRFGPVHALRGVSLGCDGGDIHAVLGENGSGKSTLLGVVSGVVAPDRGSIEVNGRRLDPGHPAGARRLGVAMAYQTTSHVAELTVAENMYLAAPPGHRPPLSDRADWAAARLERFELDFRPGSPVAALSVAERQRLEVAKALLGEPHVLLLDEPTTALGRGEIEWLHDLVTREARRGVAVLYVTHRLSEVFEIAHRVTVLRDGEGQGTHEAGALTEEDLLALMIGRPATLAFPTRSGPDGDARVALSVSGLRSDRFGPVDLTVRSGEILGLAGAEGNGQRDVLRALAGAATAEGDVRSGGAPVRPRSPQRAMEHGIYLLSGERLRETLFPVLGVRTNTTVQVLHRLSTWGWLNRRRERATVAGAIERLRVRTPSVEQPVRFLSGGNQQKVALSRALLAEPSVLLLEEPTQGVDVASRFEIYEALRELAARGMAIIVLSSDPLELAGLCDRAVVMSRGRVVEELAAHELSEARIVSAIVRSKAGDGGGDLGEPAAGAPVRPATGRGHGWWGWLPLAAILLLTVAIGAYTRSRSDAFLSEFNLNSLFLATIPLAIVSMGQLNALLVRGFDVSVGALMALTVVVGSFWLTDGSVLALALGLVGLLGVGMLVGLVNVSLIAGIGLPSIIATVATLSVVQGIALVLRPTPGGLIDFSLTSWLTESWGFVPIAFLAVVGFAIAGDFWLYRTRPGLVTRAAGMDDVSATRLGVRTRLVTVRAFVLASVLATVAGLFLAAQTGVGDARLAGDFSLTSIAAAVLGGASLGGGRGSFTGAVVGAFFLSLVVNVLPFLGWSSAYGDIATGGFILLALLLYRGTQLASRGVRGVAA